LFITPKLAQNIVVQIGNIIDQHINFMDNNATIIASTDENRIDDFHEGARIVIETKNIHSIQNNDEYLGAKNGINIPILFKKEIVGVLGITGDVNEVVKYGKIVKQMTEILILEQYSQDIIRLERERSEIILKEILFSSNKYAENGTNTFLGINFNQYFRGIVIKTNINGNPEHQFYIGEIIARIFNSEDKSTFTYFKNEKLYILTKITNKADLENKLSIFSSNLKKQMGISSVIGVGDISSSVKSLHLSLSQAEKATSLQEKNSTIFFEELDLGIILTDITSSVQNYYIKKILSNIPENEIDKYKEILYVYEKHNKSIKAGSEELYIHKNTFQYQLNKIKKYTGYNPTNLSDFVILKIAFAFV